MRVHLIRETDANFDPERDEHPVGTVLEAECYFLLRIACMQEMFKQIAAEKAGYLDCHMSDCPTPELNDSPEKWSWKIVWRDTREDHKDWAARWKYVDTFVCYSFEA